MIKEAQTESSSRQQQHETYMQKLKHQKEKEAINPGQIPPLNKLAEVFFLGNTSTKTNVIRRRYLLKFKKSSS